MARATVCDRSVLAAVAWVVLVACNGESHLDAEQKRAIVADARNAVEIADAKRRQTFATAATAIAPRPDLGTCPIVVHPIARGTWSAEALDDDALANERVGIAFDTDVAMKPGPLSIELRRLEKDTGPSDDALRRRAGHLIELAKTGQDFELVTRTTGDGGALTARVYVWDYAGGSIVCAGKVTGATRAELLGHAFEDPSRLSVAGPPVDDHGKETR